MLGKILETVAHNTVELIKSNANDLDVAHAAWVSNFGSEAQTRSVTPERLRGLINFLYREKHHSPFEHGSMTFMVDTPLFVAREFMRHRTFSYNETSGRYKEMEGRFYLPPFERPLIQRGKVGAYTFDLGSDDMYENVAHYQTHAFKVCWEAYQKQLELGVAKEVARNVLPLSLYTQFYATANPRNIMQFLILRNDKHALYEIRDVAQKIEGEFAKAMPLTYAAFDEQRDTWQKIQRLLELINLDEFLAEIEPLSQEQLEHVSV